MKRGTEGRAAAEMVMKQGGAVHSLQARSVSCLQGGYDFLPSLFDFCPRCLGIQVKVFTIESVNHPFPIHLKPERHRGMYLEMGIVQTGKF